VFVLIGTKIGIDLGTTSVIAFVENKGIVLSEPSAIAFDSETNQPVAVGRKAYEMLGKTPDSINVIRPLSNGTVSSFTACEQMLTTFINKICHNRIFKPNVIVCMPSSVTGLEKRTVLDVVTASGAASACLIEEPLAAAVGAGLSTDEPLGRLIVDIGGGTADLAVITMGNIAVSSSVKGAGNAVNEAIIRHLKKDRDIVIGFRTSEMLKKTLGCAVEREAELALIAKGKSNLDGMPITFEVTSTEIKEAISEQLNALVDAIYALLEKTPPELVGDISETGITLTGGGALLYGIDRFIENEIGIKTTVADDSLNCVAKGMGAALKKMEILLENGYHFISREDILGTDRF
jgi:rod shape-determining protein MreB